MKLVRTTTTLTTVWKGRLLLILWIIAMLVTALGYQFGLRESVATLLIWGVPTVLALVVSCLLVDWKSPGERGAQLYWLIVIPILCIITILAFNVPALNRFLEFGLLTWSVALSIGYIANGLAVRWPLMVRVGIWSLLFVLFYLNPVLEPFSYGFFGLSHAGVMALLASS